MPNTIEEFISNNLSDVGFTKEVGHSYCGGEFESLVLRSYFDALILNPIGFKLFKLLKL